MCRKAEKNHFIWPLKRFRRLRVYRLTTLFWNIRKSLQIMAGRLGKYPWKSRRYFFIRLTDCFRILVLWRACTINLQIPELTECAKLLRYTSNNVNQIARRGNSSGCPGTSDGLNREWKTQACAGYIPAHCLQLPELSAFGAGHSALSRYRPAEYRLHKSGRKFPARSSQWPKDCSFQPSLLAQGDQQDGG